MGRYKKTNPEDEARARLARPEPFGGSLNPPPELSNFFAQSLILLGISNIYKVYRWMVIRHKVRAVDLRFLIYYIYITIEIRSEVVRPVDLYKDGCHPVPVTYMLRNCCKAGYIEKISYGNYKLTDHGKWAYNTYMDELKRRTVAPFSWF